MQFKKVMIAGLATACFGAVAYAAAPRSTAPASRAVQVRSPYNPFSLKREAVTVQPAAAPAAPRAGVGVQAHRPNHRVRPPYRPRNRSPYQPPGRGPYFDPPGPPPNVPPGQNR